MKSGRPRKNGEKFEACLSVVRKKPAGKGQRPSEMEEYCIGSHGPQWSVALEVEKKIKEN